MTEDSKHTRRTVLRTGAALGVAGLGAAGTAAANPGKGDENGNGRSFGAVYANDVLWRTNVVKVLDEEPDPSDTIYFINDGNGPAQGPSPFVSESAPGDQDWNGGKWVHYSALVIDEEAFAALDLPLTSEAEVLAAEAAGALAITKGRPDFEGAPPDYFICPLNGRA